MAPVRSRITLQCTNVFNRSRNRNSHTTAYRDVTRRKCRGFNISGEFCIEFGSSSTVLGFYNSKSFIEPELGKPKKT